MPLYPEAGSLLKIFSKRLTIVHYKLANYCLLVSSDIL